MPIPSIIERCNPVLFERHKELAEYLTLGSWPKVLAAKKASGYLTRRQSAEMRSLLTAEMSGSSLWVSLYMFVIV